MATIYEGWESSILYVVEVTPGTPVTPTTAFGVVKNISLRTSAQIEEEGAIGTPYPTSLEETVEEVGGSCEFLPTDAVSVALAKRNGSGKLSSYTIFGGAGSGIKQTGSMFNQLRFNIDAGGRLRASMEWMSLGSVDNAFIAEVVPTAETMNWIKVVQNLSAEVANVEITIAHNIRRVACIPTSGTTMPVTGQKRTPYKLKEGRQRVSASVRFYDRPSENVIADIITEISTMTLICTGLVGGMPTSFTITLSNGKPNTREFTAGEDSEAYWPLEMVYKTWGVA